MSEARGITTAVQPPVGRVWIDRPEAANALSIGMLEQLADAYESLGSRPEVRSVVLQGRGKGFSAGYDHDEHAQLEAFDDWLRLRRQSRSIQRIWHGLVPVVAAVHGYCIGGAIDLIAACDLVVTGAATRFSYPGPRVGGGVPPQMSLLWGLGPSRAKELLWIEEEITAERAASWGLVNAVIADDQVEQLALSWAARIATVPRESVSLTRQTMHAYLDSAGRVLGAEAGPIVDAFAHQAREGRGDEVAARAKGEHGGGPDGL